MKKIFFIILSLSLTSAIFSENIYLSAKATFATAQFWELNIPNDDSDSEERKLMSNFLIGSFGIGFEMVILDMTKRRGSRLSVRSNIEMVFSGPVFIGETPNTIKYNELESKSLGNGAFYYGLNLDSFFGGTFPKTDLFWGIGSIFYFTFPVYNAKELGIYAVPSLLIGYDIEIGDFRISPQSRFGITTIPLIPDSLVDDSNEYVSSTTTPENWYSGFYADFSVAFSFKKYQWKK